MSTTPESTPNGDEKSQEDLLMEALGQEAEEEPSPNAKTEEIDLDPELAVNEMQDDEKPVAMEEDRVEELTREVADLRDKWLRSVAEVENVRKRSRRETETTTNLARASLLRELLEVADNFSRALDSAPFEDEDEAQRGFAEGVRLTYVQFMEILRQNGLTRIEARGAAFDPNLHEAISQIESADVSSQHVVEVVQEGYVMNDMVVRPARVVVAV